MAQGPPLRHDPGRPRAQRGHRSAARPRRRLVRRLAARPPRRGGGRPRPGRRLRRRRPARRAAGRPRRRSVAPAAQPRRGRAHRRGRPPRRRPARRARASSRSRPVEPPRRRPRPPRTGGEEGGAAPASPGPLRGGPAAERRRRDGQRHRAGLRSRPQDRAQVVARGRARNLGPAGERRDPAALPGPPGAALGRRLAQRDEAVAGTRRPGLRRRPVDGAGMGHAAPSGRTGRARPDAGRPRTAGSRPRRLG